MSPGELSALLERKDLTVNPREVNVDVLETLDEPELRGHYCEPRTVMAFVLGFEGLVQLVEAMDDIDWDGNASYVYVPLSFGPVSHAQMIRWAHAAWNATWPTGSLVGVDHGGCDLCRSALGCSNCNGAP